MFTDNDQPCGEVEEAVSKYFNVIPLPSFALIAIEKTVLQITYLYTLGYFHVYLEYITSHRGAFSLGEDA